MEMWQRFSSRARRAVVLAHNEAMSRGMPLVSTEHLLMGLLALGEGAATEVLKAMSVPLERLVADLREHMAEGGGVAEPSRDLAFTPETQRVLAVAYSEAKRLRHDHVGTEHLLIGLVHEGRGAANRLLRKYGVDLTRVRQAVAELAATRAQQAAGREADDRDRACLLGEIEAKARQAGEPLYDFHTHTFLSDGVLSPIELIRRAIVKGYSALGIADHVGAATMERAIREAARDCELAVRHWNFRAFPGVELTHVPAASIAELAAEAKRMGATHVVVHGESPVEPVEPGTNLAAVRCKDVDILAHPGLLTEKEARLAARNRVFIEITSKEGHSLGNGRAYSVAQAAGARCLLNSDTHLPDHLLTASFARTVALGAGVGESQLGLVLQQNPKTLIARIMKRLK